MGRIAVVFAGQGAQSVGMGMDIYNNSPKGKALFRLGESLREGTLQQCFYGKQEELVKTENTQPCLFLTDLACALALKEAGVVADMAAGFSLGEIPALAYCGVLSEEEAFRLVCLRGESMGACAKKKKGGMVAVLKLDAEKVEEICGGLNEVYPVNYNCPGQIVCAGAEESIPALVEEVKKAGGRPVPVAVSGAFHTPFMKEAEGKLKAFLENADVHAPVIPLYANRTGEPYPDGKEEIISLVSSQLCNPVRWEATVRNMAKEGVDTFIEVGAGKTLSGLIRRICPEAKVFNVSDRASLEATVAGLNA